MSLVLIFLFKIGLDRINLDVLHVLACIKAMILRNLQAKIEKITEIQKICVFLVVLKIIRESCHFAE